MRYLFTLLLTATLLSFGCKDEICTLGYEGKDCNIAISPKSVTITSISTTRWPSTTAWDASDDPDPYIAVFDGNFNELGRTPTILNTTDNVLVFENLNIVIDFPEETEFYMRILDEDVPVNDDMIMAGYSWFPGPTGTLNDFPSTVVLDIEASDTAFSMEVEYAF